MIVIMMMITILTMALLMIRMRKSSDYNIFLYCSSVLWWPGPSWSVLPSCPCFSSFKWYECMREKYFILFGKHWFMVTVSIIDLLKPDIKEIKLKNAWHIEDHVKSDSSILRTLLTSNLSQFYWVSQVKVTIVQQQNKLCCCSAIINFYAVLGNRWTEACESF